MINEQEYLSGQHVQGLWLHQNQNPDWIIVILTKEGWILYPNVEFEVVPLDIKTIKKPLQFGKGTIFSIQEEEFVSDSQVNGVFIHEDIALIKLEDNYSIFYPNLEFKVNRVYNPLEYLLPDAFEL